MALTASKKIQKRSGRDFAYPLAANAPIFQGGMVMLKSGVLTRAVAQADSTNAGLCTVVGIASEAATGGAADGLVKGKVENGCFLFRNSAAADLVALTEVGKLVYVVDDETVAKTSNTNVRPQAGIVVDVDASGVWVRVQP